MTRLIAAIVLAAAIVAPLWVWKDIGHLDHTAPAPAAIQAESDLLARSLGLQPVPVYQIDVGREAEAGCDHEKKCDIHLAKTLIESQFRHDNPGAFRALLAHELAHVRQAQRGEQFESLLLPIAYALVLVGLFSIGTGGRWWALSGAWFSYLTWGPTINSGFLRSWDGIFYWSVTLTLILSAVAAFGCGLMGWVWKKQNAIQLAKTSALVALASLVGMGIWSSVRTLETQPLKMELDADRVAACLVGQAEAATDLAHIEAEVAAGRGAKDDLFHSSPANRIALVKALDVDTQCQDVKRQL